MGGLDDLAERTDNLLAYISARDGKSKQAMKNEKSLEAQKNVDALVVQIGMAATAGYMDRTPTPGSPGVSMASRKMSHPVDGDKVSIKK